MQGSLQKMLTHRAEPVQYRLPIGENLLDLNPLLGQRLALCYSGQIFCLHCGQKTKKSFNQGYCYPCFIKLAQCDMCIVKPETCHYDQGTCREPSWAEGFCFQPHIVYLANSSGVKVGITRKSQIPTRWIDQGAVQALPIFEAPSRYVSGLVEVILAEHVSDKTSWQHMLKNNVKPIDLLGIRDELLAKCAAKLTTIRERFGQDGLKWLGSAEVVDMHYPVLQYPAKIKSFNFDKEPIVAGTLEGIKGQYLLFDTGVINIRKFAGYEVEVLA